MPAQQTDFLTMAELNIKNLKHMGKSGDKHGYVDLGEGVNACPAGRQE